MATLKAVKTNKTLDETTVSINSTETILLIQMLNSIRTANNSLPASAAQFIGRSLKRLMVFHKKFIDDETKLEESFVEKDFNGNNLYWDGVEDAKKTVGEGEEAHEELIVGVKAYEDKDKKVLVDVSSGLEIVGAKNNQMRLYIPTEEKLKEYEVKLKELREEKHSIKVVKINHDYLEENRISIPTKMLNEQTGKPFALDLNSFFEFLVIGGGDGVEENLN